MRARATRGSKIRRERNAAKFLSSPISTFFFRSAQENALPHRLRKSGSLALAIFASFSTDFRAKERLLAVYPAFRGLTFWYGHTFPISRE